MSEPVFRGTEDEKITHSPCGKRESFMPEYAGNFSWYCPICKEWFAPARSSAFTPVQCRDTSPETLVDVMRAMRDFTALELRPSPIGVLPTEAFYVIWMDKSEHVWKLTRTPAGAGHFGSREATVPAARAAADNPRCAEVRVLRCAQDVLEILKGAGVQ
jgi:hypothetical protein